MRNHVVLLVLAIACASAVAAPARAADRAVTIAGLTAGTPDKGGLGGFRVPVAGSVPLCSAVLELGNVSGADAVLGVSYTTPAGPQIADQVMLSGRGSYVLDLSAGVRAAAAAGSEAVDFELFVLGEDKAKAVRVAAKDGRIGTVRFAYLPVGIPSAAGGDRGETDRPADPGQATPGVGHVIAAPNPFNPTVNISFEVRSAGGVKVAIYDVRGRAVATVLDEFRQAGPVAATWKGMDDAGQRVASGVYFYRIDANGDVQFGKIALLK